MRSRKKLKYIYTFNWNNEQCPYLHVGWIEWGGGGGGGWGDVKLKEKYQRGEWQKSV